MKGALKTSHISPPSINSYPHDQKLSSEKLGARRSQKARTKACLSICFFMLEKRKETCFRWRHLGPEPQIQSKRQHNIKLPDEEQVPGSITRGTTCGSTRGPRWLFQSSRHDFRWKVEVSSQMLDSIISKVPVIVHPCKVFFYIFFGLEALHKLNNLKIRHNNVGCLGRL